MRLALSGGSTPGPIYRLLARSPLPDWDRVEIWLADERAVSPREEASNLRLVRETLAVPAGIPDARVHGPFGDDDVPRGDEVSGDALEAAARRYDEALPNRFDLILLGLGTDGHTASLFPGDPALDESERRAVVTTAPSDPRQRISITPPMITAARMCVVLVAGREKSGALRAALSPGPVREVPGRLAARATWIVATDALDVHA